MGKTRRLEVTDHTGIKRDMIIIRVPIKGTPFSLTRAMPVSDILGRRSPFHLLVAMAVLSIAVLIGMMIFWRVTTNNLVLEARFEEASKRRQEIEEKNRQLEQEINERKQVEELLRKAHDELERRVKERTIELMEANEQLKGEIEERKIAEEEKTKLQSQLQQVQKMESIGTLAGGIAHDFNNMLGIIVGNTELAMDDVPEWNPARHNLEEIRTASMSARDVVKQILAFSRQSPQQMKPVRISPIIKESLKLLRSSIPKTIEIHQNISSKSDTVRADPTQINRVLINLCTNAAHAMGEKAGVLEVSLEDIEMDEDSAIHYYDLSSGKYVRLTVSDTGHGIEPKTLERIFDPYFTTKKLGEGSGMGLSVIHGIVKTHGGGISVSSEPGKGTVFHVLFPCIEDEPEPEVDVAVEIPRGKERILFVDDEKAMVDAIQPMIERLGYKVNSRTSSIEALEAFRANPRRFDLVITDFTMPNMTGMELAKELLKLRSDIPIILCTGYSEHINEDKAKGSGIRAFVMKPVVLDEIANTIRKVLDQVKK
ncbi:MAG: response regulator [Deltaproteobacteria bacterium]|nr:response regulator [Deltaproteobacteria bacterium]